MGDSATLDVHLHPLVLVNISDHVVRFRACSNRMRVVGAVIGQQEGRRIDVHNSFELPVDDGVVPEDVDPETFFRENPEGLDTLYFQQRLGQYLEVFPRYEFLGWYSTGQAPLETDKALHKRFSEVSANENPFCVFIDTSKLSGEKAASQAEDLPVKVFDSTTHIVQGETQTQWNELPYLIDTLEAERIAITHVAKTATTATTGHSSDFTQHANSLGNSVTMLANRIKELLAHVKEMKAGRVPKSPETLRQLKYICQALQAMHPEDLRREFCSEFNDAALVVLLATLSKACANTSDLLDKFQLAHDKKHRQRHHYPFG